MPATLVAVGNGPQYGGGKRIAPHARWDDGELGVTVVGPVSRLTLARLAPTLPRAGHVGHPRVLLRSARSVLLDVPGGPVTMAYADGEPIGPLPVRAWVERDALPVLVPGFDTMDR
jgi:diacylglycerol kinase (ATP)